MKKKIVALLIGTMVMCSALAGCGKSDELPRYSTESSTQTETTDKESETETVETQETETTETQETEVKTDSKVDLTAMVETITVDDLNNAIIDQFTNYNAETDGAYVALYFSENADGFNDDNLYMSMAFGPKCSHIYMMGMIDYWSADGTMYYFDQSEGKWFSSPELESTDHAFDESEDAMSEMSNTVVAADATIEVGTLNNTDYIVASYTDAAGLNKVYFSVDENGKINLDSICNYDDTFGYVYTVIALKDVELPEDIANAEEGDYDAYMQQLLTGAFNAGSAGITEDIDIESDVDLDGHATDDNSDVTNDVVTD